MQLGGAVEVRDGVMFSVLSRLMLCCERVPVVQSNRGGYVVGASDITGFGFGGRLVRFCGGLEYEPA